MPPGERLDVRDARARLIVDALPQAGETLRLPREEAAHARARRLEPGDAVLLIDGTGLAAAAEVVRLTSREAIVRAVELVAAGPRPLPIALYVAGLRPERLAWIVEKSTELGASSVTVVASARTQSFRAAARLSPRLERIAREAAKQCGRAEWPSIGEPTPFPRVLEQAPTAHRFLLDLEGDRFPDRLSPGPASLLVGPEGGWTDQERDLASSRGWSVVRLPAGKLRADTAAIAALVLLRAALEGGKRET
jgi:16S rRNA (uracil1498-N3)-methyltransferase